MSTVESSSLQLQGNNTRAPRGSRIEWDAPPGSRGGLPLSKINHAREMPPPQCTACVVSSKQEPSNRCKRRDFPRAALHTRRRIVTRSSVVLGWVKVLALGPSLLGAANGQAAKRE